MIADLKHGQNELMSFLKTQVERSKENDRKAGKRKVFVPINHSYYSLSVLDVLTMLACDPVLQNKYLIIKYLKNEGV